MYLAMKYIKLAHFKGHFLGAILLMNLASLIYKDKYHLLLLDFFKINIITFQILKKYIIWEKYNPIHFTYHKYQLQKSR